MTKSPNISSHKMTPSPKTLLFEGTTTPPPPTEDHKEEPPPLTGHSKAKKNKPKSTAAALVSPDASSATSGGNESLEHEQDDSPSTTSTTPNNQKTGKKKRWHRSKKNKSGKAVTTITNPDWAALISSTTKNDQHDASVLLQQQYQDSLRLLSPGMIHPHDYRAFSSSPPTNSSSSNYYDTSTTMMRLPPPPLFHHHTTAVNMNGKNNHHHNHGTSLVMVASCFGQPFEIHSVASSDGPWAVVYTQHLSTAGSSVGGLAEFLVWDVPLIKVDALVRLFQFLTSQIQNHRLVLGGEIVESDGLILETSWLSDGTLRRELVQDRLPFLTGLLQTDRKWLVLKPRFPLEENQPHGSSSRPEYHQGLWGARPLAPQRKPQLRDAIVDILTHTLVVPHRQLVWYVDGNPNNQGMANLQSIDLHEALAHPDWSTDLHKYFEQAAQDPDDSARMMEYIRSNSRHFTRLFRPHSTSSTSIHQKVTTPAECRKIRFVPPHQVLLPNNYYYYGSPSASPFPQSLYPSAFSPYNSPDAMVASNNSPVPYLDIESPSSTTTTTVAAAAPDAPPFS